MNPKASFNSVVHRPVINNDDNAKNFFMLLRIMRKLKVLNYFKSCSRILNQRKMMSWRK